MASKTHPKFSLDYEWSLGEDAWNVEMDNNIKDLGLFCQPIAEAITDTPPASPVNGETHIIGVAPSGIFAGKNNQIATYLDAVWAYYTPQQGYVFYNKTDDMLYKYTGSAWVEYAPAGSGDMTKAIYDTGDTGVVDEAGKVTGIDAAGLDKYYGTDSAGTAGYYSLPAGVGAQPIGYSTDVDVTTTVPTLYDTLTFNGTNWVPVSVATNFIRIGLSAIGQMLNDEVLAIYQVVDAMTLPASLTGSSGYADIVSTGAVAIDIQKNGASIGSMDFAIATNAATFTFASPVSFAVGDRVSLVAPAAADATLGDVSLTLLANL